MLTALRKLWGDSPKVQAESREEARKREEEIRRAEEQLQDAASRVAYIELTESVMRREKGES